MYNGKAIYNPSGRAAEYSKWACNFFVGCSNGCKYCYLKKGITKGVLGGDKPQIKKCFKDRSHAIKVFTKELQENLSEIRKHGLFFTFTSDPFLSETWLLTCAAVGVCMSNEVPVKILTKRADFLDISFISDWNKSLIAIGFTLTGHDELEPNASPNIERIETMKKLKEMGFRTFASIEPIIDFESSLDMIEQSLEFCDLFKVGLESGGKYNVYHMRTFCDKVITITKNKNKVYFKDSLVKEAKLKRDNLPSHCVDRYYNLFGDNS